MLQVFQLYTRGLDGLLSKCSSCIPVVWMVYDPSFLIVYQCSGWFRIKVFQLGTSGRIVYDPSIQLYTNGLDGL
jgi:hypothetical protein